MAVCITGLEWTGLLNRTPYKTKNSALAIYRKQGKIRWDKLSRIPPNVPFHGKTFAVPLT